MVRFLILCQKKNEKKLFIFFFKIILNLFSDNHYQNDGDDEDEDENLFPNENFEADNEYEYDSDDGEILLLY